MILDRSVFVARHAEARVREALTDTRILAIVGPRQSGKTTLARRIADGDGFPFVTLDDAQFRRFAEGDPIGFMHGRQSLVIDEIQRVPDLILALKQAVDEDPQPCRFLITGSVDLFKGSNSPDSLAGRVETVELLPLSQSEIAGADPSCFLERAFAGEFAALDITGITDNLTARVLAGGSAPALYRASPARRALWLRSYARSLASAMSPTLLLSARANE